MTLVQTYTHPQDHEILARLYEAANHAAVTFNLPFKVLEHKRRPHSGGSAACCYVEEGRIAIVVRYRDGKEWWGRTLNEGNIFGTLAHELAHLEGQRNKQYINHNILHARLQVAIYREIAKHSNPPRAAHMLEIFEKWLEGKESRARIGKDK